MSLYTIFCTLPFYFPQKNVRAVLIYTVKNIVTMTRLRIITPQIENLINADS